MKAYVYVSLKKTVLDPQGKTIHGALRKWGTKAWKRCAKVSISRLTLDGGLSRDEAQARWSESPAKCLPILSSKSFAARSAE